MLAVERGADLILKLNARMVEPAAARDRKRIGHVERVERIEPGVPVGGAKRDRADRNRIAGWSEKDAAAVDDVVRADRAQFGAGPEAGDAGVETGADHELVVVPEQLVGVGGLQGCPRRGRTGRGPIDLPQHGVVGEGICELDAVKAICRHVVVVEAKQRPDRRRIAASRSDCRPPSSAGTRGRAPSLRSSRSAWPRPFRSD